MGEMTPGEKIKALVGELKDMADSNVAARHAFQVLADEIRDLDGADKIRDFADELEAGSGDLADAVLAAPEPTLL